MSENKKLYILLSIYLFSGILYRNVFAQQTESLPVYQNIKGKLEYTPDQKGNRVPDFSYCGYKSGNENIPDVPVVVFVPSIKGDATSYIQKAINYAGSLPLKPDGYRGTVLLDKGIYQLNGRLIIDKSGIVLRGSGIGETGTTLIASGKDRETLIRITGSDDLETLSEEPVQDVYVPVNSKKVTVKDGKAYHIGEPVLIRRPTTANWVDVLAMNNFGGDTDGLGWKPDRNNILWDHEIIAIDGNTIELNAPVTTALDSTYGGGFISKYTWKGRLSNVGVENLDLVSEYDKENAKDEEHCWMAITIENARNCWVRQVNFKHFAGSAVAVFESVKQVTVEDCISLGPVSEIGGQRRNTFFTSGQQTLFQRCYAEYGYHDFAVGNFAAGPNAFVQCESHLPYSFSGTIDRWASGTLFDLVSIDGNALSLKNREQQAHGAGWTAANSMLWQCFAAKIDCYSPPTATNWAYGAWGQFSGNGFWYEPNSFVKPRSLFYAQLRQRIGENAMDRAHFIPIDFGSTSSPSIELAQELTKLSDRPQVTMKDWILKAGLRNPLSTDNHGVFNINSLKSGKTAIQKLDNRVRLENGWLVDKKGIITGQTINIPWWKGSIRPYYVTKARPHITRFVPGRTGTGFTDNLEEVTEFMYKNHIVAINHHYGLWYDRRRDDHEWVRRMNGDVWPPFYEQPFARSGKGLAFDGLSKYDLTKPNYWYWMRLKEFADLADKKGLILIHQNYFQHNIIEASAHYTDFPWRTANNVNNTGFPEPQSYAGNKRIFMAEQFYDIENPQRKELHRSYIRQCLNNFSDNTNVVQMISEEYTGPLHFVKFWIDVIAEWEKETGKNAFIGLSTTKDVQDAILADPVRSKIIDIIDIKYWQYRHDGSLYAPKGGLNLARRQHARLVSPGKPSFNSVYRAVREYKEKFPEKAVIYSNYIDNEYNWAIFLAGGSMAAIPVSGNSDLTHAVVKMKPVDTKRKDTYQLAGPDGQQVIYLENSPKFVLNLKKYKGNFVLEWINPSDGKTIKQEELPEGGKNYSLVPPVNGDVLLWVRKI